jgi:hypothetical protein
VRGVPLDGSERDRSLGERKVARLERLNAQAITCRSAAELIAAP